MALCVDGYGVDISLMRRKNACGGLMKKVKAVKELKVERPPRATVSEREALKRMREFPKRKAQFLATARTGKSRNLPS